MRYLLVLLCISTNLHAQIWQIDSLFNWNDTSITQSNLGDSSRYNEVWGFTQDDRDYAVIGSTEGSHFFDVTVPSNTTLVDFIPGAFSGKSVIHRDYHDYNGYIYMVCDEGQSTLQIADLRYLPDSVHLVYDSDSIIIRAHNIFIDTAKGKLYGVAVKTHFQAPFNEVEIMQLSLANPEKPSLIYNHVGQPPVHDVYVRNDTVYANSSGDGFYVYNFANPPMISYLGSLNAYPEKGYNHAGWLNSKGDVYVFCDETHGTSIKVCDVADLQNISVISLINSGVDSNSIPHNLMIKDDFLYISYYHDGLYIFDISDPLNPFEVDHFDTHLTTDHIGYKGAWGVYFYPNSNKILISDIQSGLFIFELVDLLASVNEIGHTDSDFTLFPNPNNGQFEIKITDRNEGGVLTVYNILGNLVFTQQIGRIQTNVRLPIVLESGMYFVRFNNGDYSETQRFVLNRE